MKQYLNVCDLDGAKLAPVDIISFGSPCQDLSVAGKRAGMKHEGNGDDETTRSGLFMEAVRIIREMREATNGKQPRYALWENVPGAFSSNKGQDFRVVLEELAKIADETASVPLPEKGKWTNAGSIVGDGYSICWRTLDAQYHGVPQRRRRIFLVADFDGESAAEILFKCTGLPGYPPQSRESRQDITSDSGKGTEKASCYGIQGSMIGRADKNGPQGDGVNEDVSFTLNTIDRHGVCHASGFCTEHSANSRSIGYEDERSPTLRAGVTPAVLHNGTNCAEAEDEDKKNCLTPWDVQSRRIFSTDGSWPSLYGGEGGGHGYACIESNSNGTNCAEADPKSYGLDRASFNQGVNAQYDFTILSEQQRTLTARGPGAVCTSDTEEDCPRCST